MKKLLSVVLCLCLCLPAGTAALAEETGDGSFLIKVWDESGLNPTYLHFDFYVGDEYRGCAVSCPDEGEDFYRGPYEPSSPEELETLRIECCYGISNLAPEDAVLQVMMGNPAEEHPVEMAELVPEPGQVYRLVLRSDGDAAWLEPAEEEKPAG